MKKHGVFISGYSGRMGQEVANLLVNHPSLKFSGGLAKSPEKTKHVLKTLPAKKPNSVDLVIDFSLPTIFSKVLNFCENNKIPLVSGTTGLSSQQLHAIKKASEKIPILWAPNMSLGVAVINEMIKSLEAFDGADFQIEEFHHNRKLDKPSGTALFLQKTLRKTVKKKVPRPLAIRGGGIYGIHKVHAMTDEEHIIVEHSALNRSVFARGAVRAAAWLADKSPGQYELADLLK